LASAVELAVAEPATLDMTFNVGGHIFETIVAPDRVMPPGKTLWEEHPQWYGLPASGRLGQTA